MRFELNREIRPGEEGGYIEVPFNMPEDVERLNVRVEVQEPEGDKSVIDLGIRDSRRIRGWSGGARSSFRIGSEKATPGYIPGELASGEWAVLLGAYKVGKDGCRVNIAVELELETGRWLKGELHAHTNHSDGAFSLQEAVKLVEDAGLDFLALTDHNTISQNLFRPAETELVLIPAMELTTQLGHCNIYGVADPVEDFRALKREQLLHHIRTAKERGAYVSLNHPHCRNCGWFWDFGVEHDWVELWRGPWDEDNNKTLDWWHKELCGGRRLVAVGGSDFHREEPIVKHGMPCNWVFARSRTVKGILEALDRGHVTLSYCPEGPKVELSAGRWLMGDTVPGEEAVGLSLSIQADRLMEGDVIRLLTEQGEETQWTVRAGEPVMSLELPMGKRLFYRAELWRRFEEAGEMLLAAVANPVYIR